MESHFKKRPFVRVIPKLPSTVPLTGTSPLIDGQVVILLNLLWSNEARFKCRVGFQDHSEP